MNILLINHYAGSQYHGMEYRPYYLAREWKKLGHRITIVAASFSHLRQHNPGLSGIWLKEEIDGIRYIWIKTPPYDGNGIGRVINIFAFIIRLMLLKNRIVAQCRPDAVIASSTYPLDVIPAVAITRKTGAKLIFEVHDLWPLSPVELGGMSPHHPFIVVLQWAENFAYRTADRIVSLLPKAEDYMQQHGMKPDKFAYVPNGVPLSEWQEDLDIPKEHQTLLNELKQNKRFIVGYAGGHGLANALSDLIEAAALLKSEPVSFVLVGQGNEKEHLMDQAKQLGLDDVVFLPPVSKDSIPKLLSMMDALYIGWKKNPLYRFGICPNKLMDYMMAEKPIIHAVEAGNDPVRESGCGISVPPENPGMIAKAVLELRDAGPESRRAMGLKGKGYVVANHDYKVLAEKFLTIVRG